MSQGQWTPFYQATKDSKPWPLMERAAALFEKPGHALDLGCGAGRDTRYLLANGWSVTAVDREAEAIALLAGLPQERLRAVQSGFEDFIFPTNAYDLVSAQYSLPFTPRAHFSQVFAGLKRSLVAGGVFAGQLFGIRDEWNTAGRDITFFSEAEVRELVSDMTLVEFVEEDGMGGTATGGQKHWHVFHIMARSTDSGRAYSGGQ